MNRKAHKYLVFNTQDVKKASREVARATSTDDWGFWPLRGYTKDKNRRDRLKTRVRKRRYLILGN